MTNEDVINALQVLEWDCPFPQEVAEARKRVEKDNPVKPIYNELTMKVICPICNTEVNGKYCSNCGQRLE